MRYLAGARQVVRHLERNRAEIVAMLLQVAARHLQRFEHRLPHRIVEPGLDAEMEERHREAGDHDGGRHRDATEQQHQAHMQARARGATPPFDPDPCQPPGQPDGQQQHGDQVGQHQPDAEIGHRDHRRAARQDDERRQRDGKCQRGQHQRGGLAQQDVGETRHQRTRPGDFRLARRFGWLLRPQRDRWRRNVHIRPRTTGMSRSRIFLRSVLRLSPSIAAALIWLPRVAASVSRISGRSTSAITRS